MSTISEVMADHPWLESLVTKFRAQINHAFVLHGNVGDYALGNRLLPASLALLFGGPAAAGDEIAQDVEKGDRMVIHYNRASGVTIPVEEDRVRALKVLSTPGMPPPQFAVGPEALGQLERVMRAEDRDGILRTCLIINYAGSVFPNGQMATMSPADRTALVTACRWGIDKEIAARQQVVILIVRDLGDIHPDLLGPLGRYESIEVGMPTKEQKAEFADRLGSVCSVSLEDGLTPTIVASTTMELNRIGVEDIYMGASATPDKVLTRAAILKRKKEITSSVFGRIVETVDNPINFSRIAGMDYIKQMLWDDVILPLRTGNRRRCSKGVLMMGTGGTGKSWMAEAVAGESGVGFYKLNIGGQIASMWQGEGERNLRMFIKAIMSAGGIVWIDEIDQVLRRGTGNGTNQQDDRIFQQMMEWLADEKRRGIVSVMSATNRPDILDAALKRPGRFDQKVGFFPPDAVERMELLTLMASEAFDRPILIPDVLIARTQYKSDFFGNLGWTQAELRNLVLKASRYVEDGKQSNPVDALLMAASRMKPTVGPAEEGSLLALQEIEDEDLLPTWMAGLLSKKDEIKVGSPTVKGARGNW